MFAAIINKEQTLETMLLLAVLILRTSHATVLIGPPVTLLMRASLTW